MKHEYPSSILANTFFLQFLPKLSFFFLSQKLLLEINYQVLWEGQSNLYQHTQMSLKPWGASASLLDSEIHEGRESSSSLFLKNKYLFICLLGCARPQLWHAESLVVACLIQFPDQELNPGPTALGAESLSHWTTREVPKDGSYWAVSCVSRRNTKYMFSKLNVGCIQILACKRTFRIQVQRALKIHFYVVMRMSYFQGLQVRELSLRFLCMDFSQSVSCALQSPFKSIWEDRAV